MSSIATIELEPVPEAYRSHEPGIILLRSWHGIPFPFRPFAFYITRNAEAVHVDRLRLGMQDYLHGVPGSLLAPRDGDRLASDPESEPSNLGDVEPAQPGMNCELRLRSLSGSTSLEVRALLVGVRWSQLDGTQGRRQVREIELATRFFSAMLGGADSADRNEIAKSNTKGMRDLAWKLAAEWLADCEKIEGAPDEPWPSFGRHL